MRPRGLKFNQKIYIVYVYTPDDSCIGEIESARISGLLPERILIGNGNDQVGIYGKKELTIGDSIVRIFTTQEEAESYKDKLELIRSINRCFDNNSLEYRTKDELKVLYDFISNWKGKGIR